MKSNPCYQILYKSTIILLLIILSFSTSGSSTPDKLQSDPGTGSIEGVVEVLSGGMIDGGVGVMQDSIYNGFYGFIEQDYSFQVLGLAPGTYQVQYLDLEEIPLGKPVTVTIRGNETVHITISVPWTYSGMPCNELLERSFDDFHREVLNTIGPNDESVWLSELGEDRVSMLYGLCRRDENDSAMAACSGGAQNLIEDIRAKVEDFEVNYYFATFYGGTGMGHNSSRSIVGREELIKEIVGYYTQPYGEDRMFGAESAESIIADLNAIVDQVEADMTPYYDIMDATGFESTIEDLRNSIAGLDSLLSEEDLPATVKSLIVTHLEDYIPRD
jgi:hypothetical protein